MEDQMFNMLSNQFQKSNYRKFLTHTLAALGAISLIASGCGGGGGSSSSSGGSSNSQSVQGTVAAPGGSLNGAAVNRSGAQKASTTPLSTTTETGVAGLTVTVGNITPGASAGSFNFTPLTGVIPVTTASDGSFTLSLPAGTSITGGMVLVAYTGTAPTSLPATGVLVTPLTSGKVLCDPVTTAATSVLYTNAASSNVPPSAVDPTQTADFLDACEKSSSTSTFSNGTTLDQIENEIKVKISGDPTTGITLSGIITTGEDNSGGNGGSAHSPTSLTSTTAFSASSDFNGTSTVFTANHTRIHSDGSNLVITGVENATSSTPTRRFEITFPGNSPLVPGTYTALVDYSEDTVTPSTGGGGNPTATPTPGASPTPTPISGGGGSAPPPPPLIVARSADEDGFGPGGGFFNTLTVSLWSASSVQVTVTAGATASSPLNVVVASATYSPAAGDSETPTAQGTFTTTLTGVVNAD